MSDSDKPQTPPPEQPPEQAQAPEKYPKLAKLLRKEGREQKREKPVTGKPPGLDELRRVLATPPSSAGDGAEAHP